MRAPRQATHRPATQPGLPAQRRNCLDSANGHRRYRRILASIDSDATEHTRRIKVITTSSEPFLVFHMVIAETDYRLTTRSGHATANRLLADVVSGTYQLAPTR